MARSEGEYPPELPHVAEDTGTICPYQGKFLLEHHVRELIIRDIVQRDISPEAYDEYSSYTLSSPDELAEIVTTTLASIPPAFGTCVMMSAGLVAALRAHSIPAIAVLGDLVVEDIAVFKCSENLPSPSYEGEVINANWDGHCWVEIAGMICDISVFRSAYTTQGSSLLKKFVIEQFGTGKGALLSYPDQLPRGMKFNPKHVLNDPQIGFILEGLSMQHRERNKGNI